MNEIPLKQVIDASLENIKKVLDADAVVGTPITLNDDVTIIPVSKVSLGFTSGGVDFDSKANPHRDMPHFGGGNGAGMSVTPLTFLVISKGEVRLMNVNGTGYSSENSVVGLVSDLVDRSPAMVSKIRSLFKKSRKDENTGSEEIAENEETAAAEDEKE